MTPCNKIKSFIAGLDYPTIKSNKKVEYINLPCGFDIETTSHKIGENKTAFMYIWALGLGHGNEVYYGRTWGEFLEVCELLQEQLELYEDRRLVVYVHNLGYEFQFMRKYFEWVNVFSIAERKPLRALCSYGIEFRCSYVLSGYSLENTAKNLVNSDVKKLVGDLDYDLIRTYKTPLTPLEMDYVKNDIVIITAYIAEQMGIYGGSIDALPMTNTGRVRTYVRKECYEGKGTRKTQSKSKRARYWRTMQELTIDPLAYAQLKRAFMGGFTHANANYSGAVLNDVSSIDFTSSYPSVMCAEKFPMSRFELVEIQSIDQFNEYRENYALVFDIKFKNIECKIEQETYISESKCSRLVNPIINNGRIYSADELATTLTEVDYEIMEQVYQWDGFELANVRFAHKAYLPKSIVKSILDLYQDKTELKDVEGSEVEYMLSKGMLNSVYGMSVTDPVKDTATYSDEWGVEPVELLEAIDKYNNSRTRFLYYPWGLWVTAYARKNLWTGIIAAGNDYVYSDTDSLKILNYENHKEYIAWFDKNILEKLNLMCDFYGFDKKLLTPKTKEGFKKPLGVWDYEGTYSHFKTLGAKRYLTLEKDRLALTVAGLSKQNGLTYMLEMVNGDKLKVFDIFNDRLHIPASRTGKMTHAYIDNEYKFKVVDYLGEESTILTRSGVHLEICDFTLSIAEQYKEFLNQLSNGYIYKGVNYA